MRKLIVIVIALLTAIAARAQTNVNPSMSAATINSAIAGTASGGTVNFAAGTYNLTSGLVGKCGITFTGPVATPATAKLTTSTVTLRLMSFFGGCSGTPTTVQYLQFDNAGGIYFSVNNYTNINILHNQFTQIPYTDQNCGTCVGIQFDGSTTATTVANTDTNVTVEFNTIGDINSCNANGGMTTVNDVGQCGGLFVSQANMVNPIIKYNTIFHVQEGIHFFPSTYKPGNATAQCDGCDIEFNFFSGIHRNALEFQTNVINHPAIMSNNVLGNPTNGNFGTLSFTIPCCQYSNTFGNAVNIFPSEFVQNNVLYNSLDASNSASLGFEIEGAGTKVLNNLVQGSFCTALTWSYVSTPWFISNNTFQGATMASGITCPNNKNGGPGSFISSEGGHGSPPTTSGNVTGPTPGAITSVAPTISPTPTGTYSAPINVTITDNGYTNSSIPVPQGNTAIYYTTNGSTPTTASTSCLSPCSITVSPGATVSAIGMWGYPGVQPASYPAGYGFVPSPVVGAHYSAGSGPTLTGVALTLAGGVTTLPVGSSVQAVLTCSYSTVPATDCTVQDAYGNGGSNWTSSDTTKALISSSGSVSGLAAGNTGLTAQAGGRVSNPVFTLAVTASAPTLVALNVSCPTPLTVPQAGACTALCSYQPTQQLNCTHTDSNGNSASGWVSSAPSIASVSGNVVTAVSTGSAQISATVGSFTSPATVQVNAAPPPATLTSVTVTCAPGSVTVGSTVSCKATCGYSDSTTTDCTVTDSHGSLAGSWTSSVTADATINATTGVVTGVAVGSTNIQTTAVNGATSIPSTPIALPVVAAPTASVLGNNQFNVGGATSANYINATYAVTGSSAGSYTASACTFYLPSGTAYAAGSKWDCGVVLAPSPTTQSSSWLCHATYTTLGTSADVGWHQLALLNCGVLAHNTAYWIAVDTNETTPAQPGQGFWNCGSTCAGSAPTSGNGTFPCSYISATYGVYTGMGTAMHLGCGPGATYQAAQYVTLNTPTPTLTNISIQPSGAANTLVVGGGFQFLAYCNYSDGTAYQCFPDTSPYGDTVTSWTTSDATVMTIGAIGSTHPGLATGIKAGTANAQAFVTGGHGSSLWGVTINAAPVGFSPSSSKLFSR